MLKIQQRKIKLILVISSVCLFLSLFSGCAKPAMTLEADNLSFRLSGGNLIESFEIESETGGVVWKLYPKENDVSLKDIKVITYGKVPELCYQASPKGTAPPALRENELYVANAMIYDNAALTIEFKIENGKAVIHPWIKSKYSQPSTKQ